MDEAWLRCFMDAGGDFEQPCRFLGARLDGELFQGQLISAPVMAGVHGGVVDFTPGPDWWGGEGGLPGWEQMRWNWENANGCRDTPMAKELAAIEGPILELAAGPGGGWMPAIRQLNPAARVMVNDRSPGVLALWRTFLASRGATKGLCFAAFDVARPTLRSGCLAAVASFGGFGSVQGALGDPASDSVACMEDALRSGGLVFAAEMLFDPADWAHLDQEARARWERLPFVPGLTVSTTDRLRRGGFEIVERGVAPGRTLRPDGGGIPGEAARFGITLHVRWEHVKARKP